jgi:hypothetical protein
MSTLEEFLAPLGYWLFYLLASNGVFCIYSHRTLGLSRFSRTSISFCIFGLSFLYGLEPQNAWIVSCLENFDFTLHFQISFIHWSSYSHRTLGFSRSSRSSISFCILSLSVNLVTATERLGFHGFREFRFAYPRLSLR